MQILSFFLLIQNSFFIQNHRNYKQFFFFFLIYINVTFKFWCILVSQSGKVYILTINLTIYEKFMKIMFRRALNITLEIHKQSNGLDFFPCQCFYDPLNLTYETNET